MRTIHSKYLHWIADEIPILTESGVLDAAAGERLRAYYAEQAPERSGGRWAITLFSMIGSLLIGCGIILLFAHNWDQLSRTMRTVLSLTPLTIGAILSMLAIGLHKRTAFREGAGLFHALAIGSAIALIGQTYHLPSNVPAFMLTWALLAAPLMFLLPSVSVCLIYLGLITAWTGVAQETYQHAIGYWPLLLPPLLFLYRLQRKDRHAPDTLLVTYGTLFSLTISLGIVLERTVPGLWTIAYAGLLTAIYLIGSTRYANEEGFSNPLKLFGTIGIAVLAYLFTWPHFWEHIGWSHCRTTMPYQPWGIWVDGAITLALLIGWALMAVSSRRIFTGSRLAWALFPVLACVGFGLGATRGNTDEIIALIFNAYFFILGLLSIIEGCRHLRLRELNGGMALLALLIVTRFFDTEFGFLARGMAFIILGICFLVANVLMARRKKQEVSA